MLQPTMTKFTKIFISLFAIILIFAKSKGQCQTTKLCPKVDSLYEKWAFVNCQTQEQVLPYVYVQVGNENLGTWEDWENDEKYWKNEDTYWQCPYLWSKFAIDSLCIMDCLGTIILKVPKQEFPPIEQVKYVDNEFFQFLWRDTTQAIDYMGSFELSMFLHKNGQEFKPKNNTVGFVMSINKAGKNYIMGCRKLVKKRKDASYNYILVDIHGNSLSRVYDDMRLAVNNQLIQVGKKKIGFINLQGKIIIPLKYDYNYYNGYTNEFVILRKRNKYGVLNTKGKTILPFKYHSLRQISNTLFVAQDNDNIGCEYVINAERKILTKPVFYAISSFKNDTVYQNWNKATLAYDTHGNCISSKEEQEQKELFMLFIKETKTQKLYQLKNLYKSKSDEIELVFISPNYYQYKSQAVTSLYFRRWYNRPVFTNKIDFSTGKRFKYGDLPFRVTEIQLFNPKINERIDLKGIWEYEFNRTW